MICFLFLRFCFQFLSFFFQIFYHYILTHLHGRSKKIFRYHGISKDLGPAVESQAVDRKLDVRVKWLLRCWKRKIRSKSERNSFSVFMLSMFPSFLFFSFLFFSFLFYSILFFSFLFFSFLFFSFPFISFHFFSFHFISFLFISFLLLAFVELNTLFFWDNSDKIK